MTYSYNEVLLSHKERNNAICSNMDGHRDYHVKQVKDKYHVISLTYGSKIYK